MLRRTLKLTTLALLLCLEHVGTAEAPSRAPSILIARGPAVLTLAMLSYPPTTLRVAAADVVPTAQYPACDEQCRRVRQYVLSLTPTATPVPEAR